MSEIATKVWIVLCEFYGSDVITRRFGSEPNNTWIYALQGLTEDQVKYALKNLARVYPSKAPTAGEFVSLAKGGGTDEQNAFYARMAAGLPRKMLPRTDSPLGKQWLAFMRYEGVWPMEDMTVEEMEEILKDADIEDMRRQVREVGRWIEKR